MKIIVGRLYYENLFKEYDDVVDVVTLREMLGGVSDCYVRRMLQMGKIKSFRKQGKDFLVPKEYVIEFIMSEEYQGYKHRLKAQV